MFLKYAIVVSLLISSGLNAFAQSGGHVGGGPWPPDPTGGDPWPDSPILRLLIKIRGPQARWDRRIRLSEQEIQMLLQELKDLPEDEWPEEVFWLLRRSRPI